MAGSDTAPSSSSLASSDLWLTQGRFAVLLGIFIFAGFSSVLLGFETFVYRDAGFYAYPVAHYHRESFWRGEIPLWNPLNDFGLPFLAQWNTMVLYPPTLIYLLLPMPWAFGLFTLLHLGFGGMGAFRLAGKWTGSNLAGAVAGVAFACNGVALNCLQWTNYTAAIAWFPWVLGACQAAWRVGGTPRITRAAVVVALQVFTGGPEVILFTWLIAAALWAGDLFRETGRRSRILLRTVWIGLLAGGLAAVQMLPFLELLTYSHRDAAFAGTDWPMPLWGWAHFLVPKFGYQEWEGPVGFQAEQYWTTSYYAGIGIVALAVLAVWKNRQRHVATLGILSLIGMLLALGDAGYLFAAVRKLIPAAGLIRYPVKYVCLTTLSVPFLAAFGAAWWFKAPPARHAAMRRPTFLLGALFAFAIAAILIVAAGQNQGAESSAAWHRTWQSGSSRAVFLVLSLVLVVFLSESQQTRWRRALGLVLLVLFTLDLYSAVPWQNPAVPPSVYEPGLVRRELSLSPEPSVGRSRAMVSPEANKRLFNLVLPDPFEDYLVHRYGQFAICNLLDGIPKADGFFPLYPKEERQFRVALYGAEPLPDKVLDFLAISHLTQPGALYEWQVRENAFPMVTAGSRPLFTNSASALATVLGPDFDPRETVVLSVEDRAFVNAIADPQATVEIRQVSALRWEVAVKARQPVLVVFAQTFYPAWKATIDGRSTRVLRANHAFQAIEVDVGRHLVTLEYKDRAFQIGLAVSLATAALCLLLWLRRSSPLAEQRREASV